MRQAMMRGLLVLVVLGVVCRVGAAESYFPPYVEGRPSSVQVVSLQGPDYRGLPVYKIHLTVTTNTSGQVSTFIKRQYGEFSQLNQRLQEELNFVNWTWTFPEGDSVSTASLNKMLQDIMANEKAKNTGIFEDFLGINWNGQGIEWFKSFEAFMHMLLVARLPEFPPEPPIIEKEMDVLNPEVPFEKYVYLKAFKEGFIDIDKYVEFFTNYTRLTPKFLGAANDLDVRPPNAQTPLTIPYHYTKAAVHFLPGGYLNGQTVRVSYCGYTKFNFLRESILKEWMKRVHGDKNPKRILDIGTGNCFSALVLAEMFPKAEVIGIDLAAPFIRFCRQWKEQRGLKNLKFYQDNGEKTSFEAGSFDLIQYTYVLHEMPKANAEMVLKEIMRLLTPGGVMSGFEVPYQSDPIVRAMIVFSQTWGYKWNDDGPKGPEPFTREYQENTQLPSMIKRVGFIDNKIIENTIFDAVFLSKKPSTQDIAQGRDKESIHFTRLSSRDILSGRVHT